MLRPGRALPAGLLALALSAATAHAQPVNRLVFAHYFPFFARSINNKPADQDSYAANLLLPSGGNGQYRPIGGYIRSRPLPPPVLPNPAPDWKQADMELEVRDAMSRDIDGFTFNYGPRTAGPGGALRTMLAAAKVVSPGFRVVLMPDMDQFGAGDAAKSAAVNDEVVALAKDPTLFHLNDGRLVVAPYHAEILPPAWWAEMVRRWRGEGVAVALVPLFVGFSEQKIAAFDAISYAVADWGAREMSTTAAELRDAGVAHRHGKPFIAAVAPQDYRPKSFRFWESGNSTAFRNAWMSAIQGGADWVQLVTWNDYSESSQVEPSTNLAGDEEHGFFDLISFYARWFKSGRPPAITCDVLYYFLRRERTDAPAPAQARPTTLGPNASDPARNQIELLGLLTAPGTLQIEIGGKHYAQQAPAGMTSFKIPLVEGRPRFALLRGGKPVVDVASRTTVVHQLPDGTLDLTYQSGSATAGPSCPAAIGE
jgi:hypothetical protein